MEELRIFMARLLIVGSATVFINMFASAEKIGLIGFGFIFMVLFVLLGTVSDKYLKEMLLSEQANKFEISLKTNGLFLVSLLSIVLLLGFIVREMTSTYGFKTIEFESVPGFSFVVFSILAAGYYLYKYFKITTKE